MKVLSQFLPFNPGRWPISQKLLLAFLVATLLPVFTAIALLGAEIAASDLDNVTRYVQREGLDRQLEIIDALSDARRAINLFVDNPTYSDQILSTLVDRGTNEPVASLDVQTYLNENLIASGDFSRVIILDESGQVLLVSNVAGFVDPVTVGENRSSTPGYVQGTTLSLLGEDQGVALTEENGQVFVESIHVIRFGTAVFGYVIGTIDIQGIIQQVFINQGELIEIDSILMSADGRIIALPGSSMPLRQGQLSDAVQRALNGETGTLDYQADGIDYVAAYNSIPETQLVILTEADSNQTFTITLARVGANVGLFVIGFLVAALLMGTLVTLLIVPGLRRLDEAVAAVTPESAALSPELLARGDEIGTLARSIQAANQKHRITLEDLQQVLNDRLRDLQATQEVSRFAASQRDLQTLMDNVVRLITDLFPNIYHAQIFLVDDAGQYAVLRASTGEIGERLLQRGHRLEVGGLSVIGQVTDEGRVIVARDIAASTIHRRNEFLSETRAELAIPLRTGTDIIGALDVQSKESGSFTEQQINLLQIMADQIAVAIDNTRLYQESIQRLQEIAESNQRATQIAWKDYMNAQRVRVLSSESGTRSAAAAEDLRHLAMETGQPAIGERTPNDTIPIAVPILLRGQVLGAVEWELRTVDYGYEKVLLGQELVNRLAVSLDNARLFQESRRAINRERLVNEISARLTAQTDIGAILETAVKEVGQALRVPQVSIQLNQMSSESGNGHHPETE